MGRVDIEPVGGKPLEQRLDPFRKLVSVLLHVLRRNLESRLFGVEWIGPGLSRAIARPDRGVAAVPGGDRAFLVACLFGAQRRQFRLKFGCFLRGDRRASEWVCDHKQ